LPPAFELKNPEAPAAGAPAVLFAPPEPSVEPSSPALVQASASTAQPSEITWLCVVPMINGK